MSLPALDAEWLQSDASGGFASGTVGGQRSRRYHALLLTPRRPPAERVALVNGLDVWLESASGRFPLSTQHYAPDVLYPRGVDHLVDFSHDPWPRWTYQGAGGERVVQECIVDRVDGTVVLVWRLEGTPTPAVLTVRPLLSGRDYHALMRENGAFNFAPRAGGGNVTWRPYADQPAIAALTSGRYRHAPEWFRNFLYAEEAAHGLDCLEDLASPGDFSFDLGAGEAVLVLRAGDGIAVDAEALATRVRMLESARRAPLTPLDLSAEDFLIRRGPGHTIVAGYPWFTDWGRDTFIAMRGLTLARGRLDIAASILRAWAGTVSEGMLPNRFPDHGEAPEFNAVDASLWYVVAVHEYLAAAPSDAATRELVMPAVTAILEGYAGGTRYAIHMDGDGLIACGVPGVQLTWMDARTGDHVVTPRIGKPVEVQALWINALRCTGGQWTVVAERAQRAFADRFWNAEADCLFDVVDADCVPGRVDASVRPNQVFAVGGLPFALLDDERARAVVAKLEAELLTPMGLRTLAPSDPAYCGSCIGGVAQRDSAYHQGTVWPWLTGAFVDAWLRVNGDTAANRRAVRKRCLAPLLDHMNVAGLGHVSEIADGDAPHTPRGCPFQAWSLGELIRALARTAPKSSSKAKPA